MQTPSVEQRRFFETAVSTYQQALAVDTSAQAYLLARGFSQETAQAFRLGVVTSPLAGHEPYRGRLMIPYLTPAGVVNMNFRCLKAHRCRDEGCRKYLKPEGGHTNLFNVGDLRKPSDFICVAEGELDAISLSVSGLPAVGVAGVKAWQAHFPRCLEDYSQVYVFADADEAGGKFGRFLAKEIKALPIKLPEGSDVNDLFRTGGADALRQLIA